MTYSLREDAEKAIEELDGGEFGGKGRKIKVIWADHKVSLDMSPLPLESTGS